MTIRNHAPRAVLFALAALLYAGSAAAEPDPSSRGFGQLPAQTLTPEEQEQFDQDVLDQQLLEQEQQQPRPPAKRAPLQSGAKQAPSGAHPETGAEARTRTQTLRQVSGTVLGMKLVEVRGTGAENVIVLIKTHKGDRRLAIDLGPMSQLEGTDLRVGGPLAAEGYVVAVRDQQFLVATRVKPAMGPVLVIERPAQAKLAHNAGPAPSAQPPLSPKPQQETLPPLEGLERGPLPPATTDDMPQGSEPLPNSPPQHKPSARERRERQRQLVDEQQRPGGD